MTHPTRSETTFNDEKLDALATRAMVIDPLLEVDFDTKRDVEQDSYGAREAIETALYLIRYQAAAITSLRTQLAEAWTRLDYWCERSVEWDAEMLQKDKEVLEAIARADQSEVALAAQIEADAGIAGAKGWPRRMSLERYAELSVDDEARMDAADAIAAAIRSQPHDRTALDRMLAEHEVRLREAREKALREAYQAVGRIVAGYELREDFRAEEVAGKCHDAILALIEEDKEN